MAQVFLSYDRDDAGKARVIAQALERAGHGVWWDRYIQGGAQYSKEIESALKRADAVVVLWSRQSVDSAWVRDEAAAGRDSGRLVPISLDGTEPPLGFRQYQTIDIGRGRLGRRHRDALLAAVAGVASPPSDQPSRSPHSRRGRRASAGLIAAILLLAAVPAGLFAWQQWAGENGDILVSVGPANDEPASLSLARDVALKLSALQSSTATPVRLIETSDGGSRADLAFEAAASGPARATLALKSTKDSTILWSQEFAQPSGNRADLVQQVSYTGGRIVACAMEGMAGPVRLKPKPLKTYLNACAQLSDMSSIDLQPPIARLLEVIEESPRFEPAWRALLLSEADISSPEASGAEPDPRQIAELRRHLAQARAVNPTMAAAYIAEASLLPPRDFIGRTRRIEQAAERSRNDPMIINWLVGAFSGVGRLREAVELAAEVVQLDPLSPGNHSNFIAVLAYSGNLSAAKREFEKAEKLWPGTASLEDAQYRFHLRYGDPKIARALFEKHVDAGGQAFRMLFDARQAPSPATIEPFMAYVRDRLRTMENPSAGIGFAAVAYATFDRKEDFFSTFLTWPKPDDIAIISEVFFRPEFKEERADPRFLLIAQRAGLLDYWRQSGEWPDFCFETGLAYDCKAEAAKLR